MMTMTRAPVRVGLGLLVGEKRFQAPPRVLRECVQRRVPIEKHLGSQPSNQQNLRISTFVLASHDNPSGLVTW